MKKQFVCIALVCLILIASFVPFREARALELSTGEIIGNGIAFRKSASRDGKLIARLDEGTVVKILAANVNTEWYKVEYADKVGYVNRIYVNIDSSMPSYQLEYTGTVVNCEKEVNVRSSAGLKGSVLGAAPKGDQFVVTRAYYNDGWHEIQYKDQTGYIAVKYLELKAKVDNSLLTGLTVEGGTLSPKFSPKEYGYILTATEGQVTVSATANKGVKISIGSTGIASAKYTINSGNSKTIRISVGGKVKYSIYLVRDVLTVGTWNIKRGFENLVEQGWLIANERPDIVGIQEAYTNKGEGTNNLLSLRTKNMQYSTFARTIDYSSGGEYGIGQISRYEPTGSEQFALDTGDAKEPRCLQKVVYNIDGKTVSVYNTHFSYDSAAIRKKQFAAVLKAMDADTNPYKILTGDFNAKEAEFASFKKNYKIVNTSATKFYDYSYRRIDVNQIDNIIVSNNITVLNARAIPTELSDHYPLFAFLRLK